MLLKTYTKKCAEIYYKNKELDKAMTTITSLKGTFSRLRWKNSGSSSSQDDSQSLELESDSLRLEREEALPMKDTANNRAAAPMISLRKTSSALKKLTKSSMRHRHRPTT